MNLNDRERNVIENQDPEGVLLSIDLDNNLQNFRSVQGQQRSSNLNNQNRSLENFWEYFDSLVTSHSRRDRALLCALNFLLICCFCGRPRTIQHSFIQNDNNPLQNHNQHFRLGRRNISLERAYKSRLERQNNKFSRFSLQAPPNSRIFQENECEYIRYMNYSKDFESPFQKYPKTHEENFNLKLTKRKSFYTSKGICP